MINIKLQQTKTFRLDGSLFLDVLPLKGKKYNIPTTPKELLELKSKVINNLKQYANIDDDILIETGQKKLIIDLTQGDDVVNIYKGLQNYYYYYSNNITPLNVKNIELQLIVDLGGQLINNTEISSSHASVIENQKFGPTFLSDYLLDKVEYNTSEYVNPIDFKCYLSSQQEYIKDLSGNIKMNNILV